MNGIFDFWKEELHDASYDIISADLKQELIDQDDVEPSTSTHDFFDDISAASVASATLGSKSNTTPGNGALDAADGSWSSVTGDQAEEVVGWVDTGGVSSTDPLVYKMDTFTSGMPVTPNSGDINFAFHASGIFSY